MAYGQTQCVIQGAAYGAGASRRVNAQLTVTAEWAELRDATGMVLGRAPRKTLQFDAPIGTAPRKVTFPDGALFETDDNAGFLAITGQTRGAILHSYEAFGPRLIGVVLACVVASWAIWRYGLDILAAIAIAATPPALVAQMDRGTLQVLDTTMAEDSTLSAAERAKVEAIFTKLTAALPQDVRAAQDFSLLFRNMPGLGPNAFALPGGAMVMTDDFVKEFPDPDIIAGVLGHEMGHVVDQHGLYRLYRSLGSAVLIAFLAGDVGPILDDIVLEGNVLLSLSHSRGQEREADEFGLRLAAAAGYDPAGLAVFFQRIGEEYGADEGMEWLSTHPLSQDRMQQIEEFIETLPQDQ
jgi:Zn-dependent protease with chaperone function